MLEDKRKFERFDLAAITQFKPVNEVTRYLLGLTKNFSREGLSIETRGFNFTPNKNLNLEIKSPSGGTVVSLIGDVMWKRQGENTSIAGMKLIFQDENIKNEKLGKLFSYGNIPVENVLKGGEADHDIEDEAAETSGPILSAEQKGTPSDKTPESCFVKDYIKTDECKVTFRLPKEAVKDAENVTIVGDFNDWDTAAAPMEHIKGGGFKITLNLSPGREYRFRYLINGTRWENDWYADKYIPNSYGSNDSVVIV